MPHRGRMLLLLFDALTVILMAWFTVSFFTQGRFEISDALANIYLIMLGYYVGDKEFDRWKKRFHSHSRRGEYFVGGWGLLGIVMFIIEETGGKAQGLIVPHYLTFVIGGVIVMYVVTEILKSEASKHRK